MAQSQSLEEEIRARHCLERLSGDNSILCEVAQVLDLIGHSSVGLGEVLQDYASQSSVQLRETLRAAQNASTGKLSAADSEILCNLHTVMKSVKTVLDMAPSAMARNKAEAIGEKEKITRREVMRIAEAFHQSPDITMLLETEDSGQKLLDQLTGNEPGHIALQVGEGEAQQIAFGQ